MQRTRNLVRESDGEPEGSYQKCQKTQYSIHVYAPPAGTKVHNNLENSDYVVNEKKPFVLVGTAGEEWTVDAGKLKKTYLLDGKEITDDVIETLKDGERHEISTKPDGGVNWCKFIPKDTRCDVETSWGETLQANRPDIPHGDGDYIVTADAGGKPDLNDRWVVNGEIFKNTYRVLGGQSIDENSKVTLTVRQLRKLVGETSAVKGVVAESTISDALPFVQQGKWNYISGMKGETYILTAMISRFKSCNELEFNRFLNDLYNDAVSDKEAVDRMNHARAEKGDGVELELESSEELSLDMEEMRDEFDNEINLDGFSREIAMHLAAAGFGPDTVKTGEWETMSEGSRLLRTAEMRFPEPIKNVDGLYVVKNLSSFGTAKVEVYPNWNDRFMCDPIAYMGGVWKDGKFTGWRNRRDFIDKTVEFVQNLYYADGKHEYTVKFDRRQSWKDAEAYKRGEFEFGGTWSDREEAFKGISDIIDDINGPYVGMAVDDILEDGKSVLAEYADWMDGNG